MVNRIALGLWLTLIAVLLSFAWDQHQVVKACEARGGVAVMRMYASPACFRREVLL